MNISDKLYWIWWSNNLDNLDDIVFKKLRLTALLLHCCIIITLLHYYYIAALYLSYKCQIFILGHEYLNIFRIQKHGEPISEYMYSRCHKDGEWLSKCIHRKKLDEASGRELLWQGKYSSKLNRDQSKIQDLSIYFYPVNFSFHRFSM